MAIFIIQIILLEDEIDPHKSGVIIGNKHACKNRKVLSMYIKTADIESTGLSFNLFWKDEYFAKWRSVNLK